MAPPHYLKRVVCLANSTKKGGRCLAGKDIETGEWIRPVGDRPSGAVWSSEYALQGGGLCKLLDVVDIPLLRAEPRGHQTENHVIDAGYYWGKTGQFSWTGLPEFLDRPTSLWLNNARTKPGLNDCIPEANAARLTNSLFLIEPEDFSVVVGVEHAGTPYAKRGVRGKFRYRGVNHSLRVTHPEADAIFRRKPDGDYPLENVYLCISLTEPFDDHRCHKLVAAIFSERPLR